MTNKQPPQSDTPMLIMTTYGKIDNLCEEVRTCAGALYDIGDDLDYVAERIQMLFEDRSNDR